MALTRLSNQSLTSISSLPAAISTGKVLQVVTFTSDTEEGTSNTTWTGTSKRLSITPSSTSNKIFIMYTGAASNSNNSNHGEYTLFRETTSTNLGNANDGINQVYDNAGIGYYTISMSYLDSPSTSSSVEYRVYMRPNSSGTTVNLGRGSARSILTLMEIAG